MEKIDYKKVWNAYYDAAREPKLVRVPAFAYLAVDGMGDPNTSEDYKAAVEALYAVSYAVKFLVKKSPSGPDYGVMPLEGLWWTDRMEDFSYDNKSIWKWTMLILQPEPVTGELVHAAMEAVKRKKELAALQRVRYEAYQEGPSVQLLHTGPYAEEAPTIGRLHDYIEQMGWELTGKHHEIYLNDPRRTAPERLRTIIRQPVRIPEET
ncbi:GyrI-like domain-containing protein [Gorillibacterium sp. sgz5001074]|uniref:GyrI-like domain-containing protein n=1 Tax=Gorillibacterium sp. sgz5001074 TaxID=3446695 RepID=UPI003F6634E4